MMHRAWSSIVEVPYCFSRSYVKFQGHMALKIVEFDPNWAFPDCNSSLNSPMAMKCCTNLEKAMERCPIVFQGHPSNHTVQNITDFDPNWAFPDYRPVAAFKSLRFALFSRGTYPWSKFYVPWKGGSKFYIFSQCLEKGGQNRGAYQPTSLKGCPPRGSRQQDWSCPGSCWTEV